jgi:hypothetical protein
MKANSLATSIGKLIAAFFPKRYVDGVRVTFTDIAADREACLMRIHLALESMRDTGVRYGRLADRIRHIVVWPGDQVFAVDAHEIYVPSEALLGVTDLMLASVLVHEATHLRVYARGIRYEPQYRWRIERLCISEQVRFLRCFREDGEALARAAEDCLNRPWWTGAEGEKRLDRAIEKHNLPKWLKFVVPSD